jgi:hypothetical protein
MVLLTAHAKHIKFSFIWKSFSFVAADLFKRIQNGQHSELVLQGNNTDLEIYN